MSSAELFWLNWQSISHGWESMAPKIRTESDFDTLHVVEVGIHLATSQIPMRLVFRRTYKNVNDMTSWYDLDLYNVNSDMVDRAPSGLSIIWSFEGDHHRISTTEVMSLSGFSGCGLATALVKLADRIIVSKLIPLTVIDPKYRRLPIIGSIEDCAHDSKGKVSRWTTFCAQRLGYEVAGKNDNGWPLLTKQFK